MTQVIRLTPDAHMTAKKQTASVARNMIILNIAFILCIVFVLEIGVGNWTYTAEAQYCDYTNDIYIEHVGYDITRHNACNCKYRWD